MKDLPRNQLLAGILAELPILVGVVPFGLIFGAYAVQASIPIDMAQAMSAIIFAGSAQFVSAGLINQGVPALVVIATALVLNLRHMFYSASVAGYIRHLPTRWKLLLAYLLTDEAYAVVITHFTQEPDERSRQRHWFFLGAGFTLWASWQMATAVGIFLGMAVPAEWPLDFALALTFIALLFPLLKDRPSILAALSAGIAAILFAAFPYRLGLIAAAAVGIAVGAIAEGKA